MERERYLNTSLAKALGVLDLFNGAPNGLTLTEVARAMGARPGASTLSCIRCSDSDTSIEKRRRSGTDWG